MHMPQPNDDHKWMRSALVMARKGDGLTAPNPSVGCVIIKDNGLIGRGVTASGGRPHAETLALADAGQAAKGATAYVTLEPCAHTGKTPPCAQTLIDAGISRVVIGLTDPDERVAGKGLNMLKAAGIEVTTGILEDEISKQLAGYLMVRRQGRPFVTVKIASSQDARIALKDGTSQWITGADARRYVHELRSRHDVIMTGMGTVRADDPMLNCRLEGVTHHPMRVVLSTEARLDPETRMAQTASDIPTLCLTGSIPDTMANSDADIDGLLTIEVGKDNQGRPDVMNALSVLAKQGMTSVLVEAGGILIASLMRQGLVDRLIWIKAPMIIGGDGIAAINTLDLSDLDDGRGFTLTHHQMLGEDMLEIFERI
ncbi:MAG: bifunctional diaminohydroxyphosphoribosylaminopyrimidine deaminase/5-amino-6-(5-phosphoribosylamino)uracil reductase RibD [Candidatus Puniceispirillales bacterium]